MKNKIISKNNSDNDDTDVKSLLGDKIGYLHQLIQKTILSIQKYKQQDVMGANELNQGVQTLERLYLDLTKIKALFKNKNKNKTNITTIIEELESIRTELSIVFKVYGTENISDLLNVVFGDDYISSLSNDKELLYASKYSILDKHFHPFSFKIVPWKNDRKNSLTIGKSIEKNKIVDDMCIVEKSPNLDCFDLCRTSDTFQLKVYGVKIAFHNVSEKKTLIVSGLIDDLLITCIDNEYLANNLEYLIKE